MGVPYVHRSHAREIAHGFPVAFHGFERRRFALLFGKAAFASADFDAGGQALHVPFPRSLGGFVEVVDVEDEAAFGGVEQPEIGHMGVAARLDPDAGGRSAGQVGRHDRRRTPEKRERRRCHAFPSYGNELLDARFVLFAQDRHGAFSLVFDLPGSVAFARRRRTKFFTVRLAALCRDLRFVGKRFSDVFAHALFIVDRHGSSFGGSMPRLACMPTQYGTACVRGVCCLREVSVPPTAREGGSPATAICNTCGFSAVGRGNRALACETPSRIARYLV